MGLPSVRALGLAVLVLACVAHCGLAITSATKMEIIHSTPMDYTMDDARTSGGVFMNLTGAESQVFMWAMSPSTPYIVSWDVNALLSSSNVPKAQLVNGSTLAGSSLFFSFTAAATDGSYMYLVSLSNVWKVDPANIDQVAQNVTLPSGILGSTAAVHLSNATTDILVISSLDSTDLAIVNLQSFAGDAQRLVVAQPPLDSGAASVIALAADEAFLAYSGFDFVVFSRISLRAPSLQPVVEFTIRNIYMPNAAPMVYVASEDMLYLLVQNVDADKPVLVALNLTAITPGAELNVTTTAKRAVGKYGDPIRAIVVEDPDTLVPQGNALVIDEIGGQALVYMANGVIMRVNTWTLEIVTPSLIISSDPANPAGLGLLWFGDATSSEGNRNVLAWTKNTISMASVATSCPEDCLESRGFGVCSAGQCMCSFGHHGANCSGIACTSDCGSSLSPPQGECGLGGACVCLPDWTYDSNCTARQCPSNCFGNGDCDTKTFTCTCNSQWAGADCSIAAFLACSTFKTEEACVQKAGACGWCADTKTCQSGNLDGPYLGSCRAWYSGGKSQVGLLIAAIIVIIIFFLMLIVGLLSAAPIDYVTAGILVDSSLLTTDFLKESYWRDERSAKTWKMFDLFQFISYYAFIDVSFPTQIIQFSRYFNWANLMLPLPYGYEDNKSTHKNRLPGSKLPGAAAAMGMGGVGRNLLNVEQYANSVKVTTEHVFYGTMFWFGILVCGVLAIYGIYALIMWLCLRRKEPNIGTVLLQKFFYVLTRLVLIGYMPINFTAAWHIRGGSKPHLGSIAAAIVAIILFGILPIVFNAVVVWNKGKELLFLYLKLRFGALYSVFHYEKARFHLAVLLRKFAIALLLGFLAAPSTSQDKYTYAHVFTIVGIFCVYLIGVIIVRPYLDQVHLVLDIIMCVLFAIAFGVAVLHKKSPSTAGQIVAGVCYILVFLACILAFAHSWWSINGRNTYPWIMCGPKYGGLNEKETNDDEEMDTAAVIRDKKKKEAALAGVMPTNKPSKNAQPEPESSEVDSSLQSSSEEEDDDEDDEGPIADQNESSEEPEQAEAEAEDEDEDEDEDEESEESD